MKIRLIPEINPKNMHPRFLKSPQFSKSEWILIIPCGRSLSYSHKDFLDWINENWSSECEKITDDKFHLYDVPDNELALLFLQYF